MAQEVPGPTPKAPAQVCRLFGRRVDLHTAKSLSPYFREEVFNEARPLYEETEPL